MEVDLKTPLVLILGSVLAWFAYWSATIFVETASSSFHLERAGSLTSTAAGLWLSTPGGADITGNLVRSHYRDPIQRPRRVSLLVEPSLHEERASDEAWIFSIHLDGKSVTAVTPARGMSQARRNATDPWVLTGAGDGLEFTVMGDNLQIIAGRHRYSGLLRIVVDGGTVAECELYSRAPTIEPSEVITVSLAEASSTGDRWAFDVPPRSVGSEFVIGTPAEAISTVSAITQPLPFWQLVGNDQQGWRVTPFRAARWAFCISAAGIAVILYAAGLWFHRQYLRRSSRGNQMGVFICVGALIGVLAALVFGPGVGTNDTVSRWVTGIRLLQGQREGLSDFFPLWLSLLQALSYKLVPSYIVFLGLQVGLLLFALLYLSSAVVRTGGALAIGLVVLVLPVVGNHAVYQIADTWTTTGILLTVGALAHGSNPGAKWFDLVLLCIGAFLLIVIRSNAVVLTPLVLLGIRRACYSTRRKLVCATAVGLCVLAVPAAPRISGLTKTSPASLSMIWEYVGMAKLDESVRIRASSAALSGNLSQAIEVHNWITHDTIVFGDGAPFPMWQTMAQSSAVRDAWLTAIRQSPVAFVRTKLNIYWTLLGMSQQVPPLLSIQAVDWTRDVASALGTGPSVRMPRLGRTVVDFWSHNDNSFRLYTPCVTIAVSIVMFLLAARLRLLTRTEVCTFVFAFSYYLSFFILCPGFNFRYYLPSFVLCVILIFACAVKVIEHLKQRLF